MSHTGPAEVDFLILGAGWTSTFLLPQLTAQKISHAATSTSGRDGTIPFVFDPDSTDQTPYTRLPLANTVLITFPLKGREQPARLLDLYKKTHAAMSTNWIQLGSTGIYNVGSGWQDHESDYDVHNARAVAEDALLELHGCVLNLAGLYGGARQPRNWVGRVAKTKAQLREKNALHLIHGDDVAQAVIRVHRRFSTDRWLLTDLHVYDWWELVFEWGDELTRSWEGDDETERPQYRQWVVELMHERGVRALPRSVETLGRVLDSTAFWKSMGILPTKGRAN